MAVKDFTKEQSELLLVALDMFVNSYQRRINMDKDVDAQAVWQKKIDAANVLASKIRLT